MLPIPMMGSMGVPGGGVAGGLGPELLVNGDFSGGATGWTVTGTDATHIATFSGGTLRYQSDTTSPQLIVSQATPPLTATKLYELNIIVSAWVSGGIKTDISGASVPIASAAGTFTYRLTAASAPFSISRSTANVDMTIDSISVREVL